MRGAGGDTLRQLAAMPPLAAAPDVREAEPALLAAAQAALQFDLQRPLALQPRRARMLGRWGFVEADLHAADGGDIELAGAPHRCVALLAQRGGHWQVVESRVGTAEVPGAGWAERFHVPPSLFARP